MYNIQDFFKTQRFTNNNQFIELTVKEMQDFLRQDFAKQMNIIVNQFDGVSTKDLIQVTKRIKLEIKYFLNWRGMTNIVKSLNCYMYKPSQRPWKILLLQLYYYYCSYY